MNKFVKIILISFFAVFLLNGIAMAATFTISHHDNETDAITALNNWLAAETPWTSFSILEDFESFPALTPGVNPGETSYASTGLNTTFTATGSAGQGSMSFDTSNPQFGVMERDDPDIGGSNLGRTLNWDDPSFFDEQYLDSGDMTEITLNTTLVAQEYEWLFFFMFDVADIGGTMTVSEVTGGGNSEEMISGLDNGMITFVGIEANSYIEEIVLSMNSSIDGFGVDNFGVPVPEPATMMLLGSGLLGLAAVGRKKFFKKK
jgi:hypothetical protein